MSNAFTGRNKSAIIAELMLRAVEEQKSRKARAKAIDSLLARRGAKAFPEDVANVLAVEKYSFHWHRNDGTPICRWDNAPHHRDLDREAAVG